MLHLRHLSIYTENLWELPVPAFYKLDDLPVTEPAVTYGNKSLQ